MTYNIKCKVKRMTAKQQHRLLQMFQLDIDLRQFVHFTAQSLKFEELEKREKNPIRREYYHKLNILKQERAMMYMERHLDKHHRGGIGTPRPNTGEMVITKEQATELTRVVSTPPPTDIVEVEFSGDIMNQLIQRPSKPLQQ